MTQESGLKTVLHVGCGPPNPIKLHKTFQGLGWTELRLDIDPKVKPDIIATITDMSPVAENSVDAVWSSHNLEHLFAHEVPVALKEFYRVVKPGGFVLITMPDLQEVAEHIAKGNLHQPLYTSPAGPICPIDIVYGHRGFIARGNHFMAHKTGFTVQSLGQHLVQAGFIKINVKRENLALWANAFKPETSEPPSNINVFPGQA